MKTASCKAKGRRACQEVVDLLYKYAPDLRPGDIRITSSSVCGEDIQLSPAALEIYPFKIECKNVEKLNIWKALEQAQSHNGEGTPVLFFKRNRSDLYVAIRAEDFQKLTR
jgi:hypothetical protein